MVGEPGPSGGTGFWPSWLTPRRIWQFISNVVALERTVRSLQDENKKLRSEFDDLQKTVIGHDAELRLLTAFVRESLTNRLEARIDKLAAEILENKTKK